ncbi:hypothetical protein TCAL_05805 [Tigriopus californicus]|uniref:CRAL-TRIO domain-containing protein n=1 Tax=Tigriopus californicus TaxID=6832 RepID=A0A553PQ69_TIGCA|nr:alpha-tocopherol transfer protein-like [Tigriopus californicus]TRY79832.1 hypothetical protein TCAL_05805 [Tigriopus californicus]|eukprot:TCALIF_05805-PA protein Name:"Similar to TTPA Alpha-tocopherol transfer protein (Homo sapiens)" AED:0.00 eAED:0.00 QI:186/1/1/1/0.75/1/5/144/304
MIENNNVFDPLAPIEDDVEEHAEPSDLDDNYKALAKTIFNETPAKSEGLLDILRHRILDEEKWNVPTSNRYLLKMLRAGNYDVEGALQVIREYYTHFQLRPNYFRFCTKENIDKVLGVPIQTVLPHRDRHQRRILILRTEHWDPATLTYPELFCAGYMLCELMSLEPKNQIAGVTCVVDLTGYSFAHMHSFTWDGIKSSIALLQNSFPLWMRAVHFVNVPLLFRATFHLISPMLSDEMKECIFMHYSLEDLYDHLDPAILPTELGGTNGPLDNENCKKLLFQMLDYFQRAQTYSIKSNAEPQES